MELSDEEKDKIKRGVYMHKYSEKDQKIIEKLIRLAQISKIVSRTKVAVKVFRDGQLQELEEQIGNEDLILQMLIATKLNDDDF